MSEFVDSLHSSMKSYFLMVMLFKLDSLSEDLPAILRQDDLLFGCPLLHLSKGFQGNTGSVKSSVSPSTKGFFTNSQADKFGALSTEIDVTSLSKGTLIRLVEREK